MDYWCPTWQSGINVYTLHCSYATLPYISLIFRIFMVLSVILFHQSNTHGYYRLARQSSIIKMKSELYLS